VTVTELAHTHDPITSHEAAASLNADTSAELKGIILELLGRKPRAQFELTRYYVKFKKANGWPDVKDDSVAKRLSELVKAGRVIDSGRKTLSPYDRNVVVWQVAA
jgi:hypothetical protein